MIMLQPVIELQQICDRLRCGHQLSVPWNASFFLQQILDPLFFYDDKQRGIRRVNSSFIRSLTH